MKLSRRDFIRTGACVPLLAGYRLLAEPEKGRYKIRDIQSMVISGPRTYTLVRVVADNGAAGIAEAYGSPAIGVKEQILDLKPLLVGKDPLGIDALYTHLGEGGKSLSGTRTDGSAHSLMRAASGIEMALWDLAGRLLGQPVTTLLGGKFRDRVRLYDHEAPKNMLDKLSCREWAAKVKEDKSGFTAHKFGFPHTSAAQDGGRIRGTECSPLKRSSKSAKDTRTAGKRSAGITTSWFIAIGNTICARLFRLPKR